MFSDITVEPDEFASKHPVQFLNETMLPALEEYVSRKDLNLVTSAVILSASLLQENTPNKTEVVNTLLNDVSIMEASSVDTVTQMINAMTSIIKVIPTDELEIEAYQNNSESVNKMLTLSQIFATEGINLESHIFNGLMDIIGYQLDYGLGPQQNGSSDHTNVSTRNDQGLKRKRRNIEHLSLSYNSLINLYSLILSGTIPGEKHKNLTSNNIHTFIKRDTGANINTKNTKVKVGSCSTFADISRLKEIEDMSVILECSNLDPYIDIPSSDKIPSPVATFSYKDQNLNTIPVINLSNNEEIEVRLPAGRFSTIEDVGNETWLIKMRDVRILKLHDFSDEIDLNSSGIHTIFTIDTDVEADEKLNIYLKIDKNFTLDDLEKDHLIMGKNSSESKRTLFISGR